MDRRVAQGPPASRLAPATDWNGDRIPAIAIGIGIVVVALLVYWISSPVRYYNHFVWQALAFLHGRAAIDWPVAATANSAGNAFFQDVFPVLDAAGNQTGRALLPFPPLPALVLLPFVAIWGVATDERLVSVVLGALDVGLAWWLLGGLRISRPARLLGTVFFGFGTVFWYAAQLGTTWFFAHVVAIAALLAAVGLAIRADPAAADDETGAADEQDPGASPSGGDPWRLDGRQLLIGFLFGLACTARLTIIVGAPFFILVGSGGTWFRRGLSAAAGAAIPVGALLLYNVATTGHLFHPGYDYLYRLEAAGYPGLHYNLAWSIEDPRYLPQNIQIALFSLPAIFPDHVPSALGGGDALCTATGAVRGLFDRSCPIALPRDVGMSLILTSPAYLLAAPVVSRWGRSRLVTGGLVAVLGIALVNLMHFSQGWVQFGYRFSNDFVVFALPLVAIGIARGATARRLAILLVAASVLVNFWGVTWGNLLGW